MSSKPKRHLEKRMDPLVLCRKQEAAGSAWQVFPNTTFRPPWSEESITRLAFEHARSSPSTNTGLGTTLESRSSTGTSPETGRVSASHWRPLWEGRSSSEVRGACLSWRRCYGCLSLLGWGAHEGSRGSHSRSPCASQLCRPVPKHEFREEGRGFLDWLSLQHIRGIQFYIHQDLVYHVSGGTDCI